MKYLLLLLLLGCATAPKQMPTVQTVSRPDRYYCPLPTAEVITHCAQVLAANGFPLTMVSPETGIVQAKREDENSFRFQWTVRKVRDTLYLSVQIDHWNKGSKTTSAGWVSSDGFRFDQLSGRQVEWVDQLSSLCRQSNAPQGAK